jgi:hypothetical protein
MWAVPTEKDDSEGSSGFDEHLSVEKCVDPFTLSLPESESKKMTNLGRTRFSKVSKILTLRFYHVLSTFLRPILVDHHPT